MLLLEKTRSNFLHIIPQEQQITIYIPCKVPHKRKFQEAPCHNPEREKVIRTGNNIDNRKLKLFNFYTIENLKKNIAMLVNR